MIQNGQCAQQQTNSAFGAGSINNPSNNQNTGTSQTAGSTPSNNNQFNSGNQFSGSQSNTNNQQFNGGSQFSGGSQSTGGSQFNGGSQSTGGQSSDPNCLQYNNNMCQKCSQRFYVGTEGRCVPVNPLCQDSNERGQCTSCYRGYMLNNGQCIIAIQRDPNCKQLNNQQQCIECYNGFYPSQGTCKRANPLCKAFNPSNGYCTDCYQGYSLNTATGNC